MTKYSIEPNSKLLDKVCASIQNKKRSFLMKRIVLFTFILSVCALAFIPSLNMLVSDVKTTGFLHFFALAFSDTSVVAQYWKSFLMILAESLPVVSLVFFLAIVLGILQSIKYLVKDIQFIKKAKA